MARPLRIQYPGAVYHVMCRGNDRIDIFREDDDRTSFLRLLSRSLNVYSVNLHAYVLMTDHFHFLLETPLGNLAEFMRHFNISYTGFFNRKHKRIGHLYQGRYKSILVEKEAYLSVVSRYIHLNPIRLKSLKQASTREKYATLCQYKWSSLPGYLDREKQQAMVDCSLVLADFGGQTPEGIDRYRKQLIVDIAEDLDVNGEVFGQSILGDKDFIAKVKCEYFEDSQRREKPSVQALKQFRQQEMILAAIEKETGKNLAILLKDKGDLRRVAMDLLYRLGGLKGPGIGALFGVSYSAVSQERKRLREGLAHDRKLKDLMRRIECCLSTIKI